jgi:hypothetical protein
MGAVIGIGRGRSGQTGSSEAKLQQFRKVTIAHPHLLAARERLITAISDSPRNSVVFVLGPTGVGKTTLRAKVESDLTARLAPELMQDKGRLPVVSVEAVAPDTGNFSWRDHFRRLLDAMRERLIDYKLDRKGRPRGANESLFRFDPATRSSGAEYQYAVEHALRYRRPAAVLIDEAQHLAKMSSGRRLLDQLDVIKSIANCTGTPHVLMGTYDLLAFRNLSGQLSRRSIDVQFGRYRADRPGEAAIFANVLRSFAAQLPLAEPPDLIKDWEFLYERSIGCVGILKEWLVMALSSTFGRSANRMDRKDLDSCALSVNQCDKLLSECIEGETRLEESDDGRLRLRVRLGLNGCGTSSAGQHRAPAHQAQVETSRKAKRRPGQRRAKRDPIGRGIAVHGT